MSTQPIVLVPGSFDPLHSGHIALLEEASIFGTVIVLLKGDDRLKNKNGKILMKAIDRKVILESIKYVGAVLIYDSNYADSDDFSEVLKSLKPDFWAIGEREINCGEPDYLIKLAEKLGIKILYGIGGERIHSSSEILKNYATI